MFNISLTDTEFRRLLDLVYIGNWILNSTRDINDRIKDYDKVESKIFGYCKENGFGRLYDRSSGIPQPSQAFEMGGILNAVEEYENSVFFEILAEELARRDLETPDNYDLSDTDELTNRIEEYMAEFEENGLDNVTVDTMN